MQARRWIDYFSVAMAMIVVGECSLVGFARQLPTAPPTSQKSSPPPAPLAGFSDKGVFLVYKNEERIATIKFRWDRDGTFDNQHTLSLGGQSVSAKLHIPPTADGPWREISMESPLGPVSITRQGDLCRIECKSEVQTLNLKPDVVLWENFAPALISQAVRRYDKAKGGKQTFPLFILPKRVMEASLELQDTVERWVNGRELQFTRYRYALPGVDAVLWADAQGKLYLADLPALHAAYVREGYEILRRTPEADPLLSKPRYEITVEQNVNVPMRDGLELATDIYRPLADGRFPAILVRTPYKKEMSELEARYYARRGYVFAVQDCRGRFGSPGAWEPFVNEAADGYDSIEWLASQTWCTGKVGMIGASYKAWVQWWAACLRPPHLVTIIPNVSPPDPFYAIPYDHGVFSLLGSIWWADVLESEATADLSGATYSRIGEKDYHQLLRALPVIDLDKAVLGKENPYWRKWIAHPALDGYWEKVSFLDRLKDVNIPVFHQSGWFDGTGIGAKLNYLRMVSLGHRHQKLVLGPWGHTPVARRRHGDHDFGPEAVIDLERAYLRWFDYWLKGVGNGIAREPLVSIFVMGSNHWLHGNTYPLEGTRYEKWYISSRGYANTSRGDGWLTTDMPPVTARPDRYTYDPGDPTPDPQRYHDPEDTSADTEKKVRSAEEKKQARDAYHEKVTSSRRDILVYQSRRFRKPYTFAGPISAVLYASSSAPDTDWFVRLLEVGKEGKLLQLAEGKVRARYRDSLKSSKPLIPGKVYEYHIDLWQTGITIPPGHRLRVEIVSASFPTFSRNLNTGGHNETETEHQVAQQTIYHQPQYPSHIVLPVIADPFPGNAPAK
ncbi:MAG: CocE/NonD family hydrolase [Phycisphaerae bacterium]|nr:CocE/NonD family hydrolase [Phycisphaerae bacterium]